MNAKPTPGLWEVNAPGGFIIRSIKSELARVGYSIGGFSQGAMSNAPDLSEAAANAALIVAAVNACFKVNPSNPLAVAEALPTLVDAARKALTTLDGLVPTDTPMDSLAVQDIFALRSALAKIEAKS